MLPKRPVNILYERAKERKQTISKSYQNETNLSKKMDNYERGYEIDPEEIDNRSNFERTEDKQFVLEKLRTKLAKLFADDGDEIDTFVDYLVTKNGLIEDFNRVYNQLLEMGDPKMNTAKDMIIQMKNLLENQTLSKNITSSIDNLIQIIQNTYSKGLIDSITGNDLTDRLEAEAQKSTPSKDLEKIAYSNQTDEEKLQAVYQYLTPPKATSLNKKNKTDLLEDLRKLQFEYNDKKKDYMKPTEAANKAKKKRELIDEIILLRNRINSEK